MRDATFDNGDARAGPVTLDLACGERTALQCASPREAAIVALMAAGIVKASSGCVLIGDYDPCVQSVACKRIAAFVPHEPLPLDEGEFVRYVAYRAALWNIEPRRAHALAELLRKRLAGIHEAFAYPVIGALLGMPRLVVLDRPPPAYARQVLDAAGERAVFSTHADAASAAAFTRGGFAAMRATRT
jgi:hypothetical protein